MSLASSENYLCHDKGKKPASQVKNLNKK